MKRHYRGTVQAEVAELTRQRLFDAAIALYLEFPLDQITLNQVAERAGVTVQTILRHFKTKDGLFYAAGKQLAEKIMQQRDEAPVGDIQGALRNLIEHYEAVGQIPLRSLALEGRSTEIDGYVKEGRDYHRAWVERVFAPFIGRVGEMDRERFVAQLVTLCDVYTWKLLRLDAGLTREQTELAMNEMLTALLAAKNLIDEGRI
ncbi:MAG: TetR/AcrR family transcriptional regulator [Anaerolineae bacterium]|nr:TetR/AcrR family transcriptional regulator [Anaerolineae bacterium]